MAGVDASGTRRRAPRPAGAAEVSVIVPTRNRRRLLARALSTVLAQDGVTVEVIVVDEASDDGTADDLARIGDDRVVVVRHDRPKGVAAARNAGLERAKAPWVAFVDDDDVWSPHKLRAQLEALGSHRAAAWSCAGAVVVDQHLRVVLPQMPPDTADVATLLLGGNVIPGGASGVVARTDLVRAVGGFDTSLSTLADYDLWIRLALQAPLAPVPRPLVGYMVHPGGMAHGVSRAEAELAVVEAKYEAERAARGIELSWWRWLLYFGALHLRAGRRVAAARTHVRFARRVGGLRGWKLAAAGLVWPGIQGVRDRRRGASMLPEWREEAESWLAPLRGPVAAPAPSRIGRG